MFEENNQKKLDNGNYMYYNYNSNNYNNMNNGGNFFGKGKKNFYGKKYKKIKEKKSYYNNIRNQSNNFTFNDFVMNNNNYQNDNAYDDTKINLSITDNSTLDTMSNNKYDMNSGNNNIIYKNNNIIFYNNKTNKIQRNRQFNNNQNNQYIRNKNVNNNNIYNHINNFNNQKYNYTNNKIMENYLDSNLNNKFNINNSLDNINNFYNMNKNFIPNTNNTYKISKNKIAYKTTTNNINHINNASNIKNGNVFNKLNLNLKLGDKDLSKEIMIDIENDDISKIVNNILIEYKLKENYFEPLVNIIEKSINVLLNFDKIKPSKYAIKNLEEKKNILDENIIDMDDSIILDLIEKNNYKDFFSETLCDIHSIKTKQERNLSCSYKNKKKNN